MRLALLVLLSLAGCNYSEAGPLASTKDNCGCASGEACLCGDACPCERCPCTAGCKNWTRTIGTEVVPEIAELDDETPAIKTPPKPRPTERFSPSRLRIRRVFRRWR